MKNLIQKSSYALLVLSLLFSLISCEETFEPIENGSLTDMNGKDDLSFNRDLSLAPVLEVGPYKSFTMKNSEGILIEGDLRELTEEEMTLTYEKELRAFKDTVRTGSFRYSEEDNRFSSFLISENFDPNVDFDEIEIYEAVRALEGVEPGDTITLERVEYSSLMSSDTLKSRAGRLYRIELTKTSGAWLGSGPNVVDYYDYEYTILETYDSRESMFIYFSETIDGETYLNVRVGPSEVSFEEMENVIGYPQKVETTLFRISDLSSAYWAGERFANGRTINVVCLEEAIRKAPIPYNEAITIPQDLLIGYLLDNGSKNTVSFKVNDENETEEEEEPSTDD